MTTPKFYDVPAETRPSECRGKTCRGEIYWVKSGEKSLPVDCDVDEGYEPTAREIGRSVSHFTTCPDVKQFSGKNRA
jgi:hypothetical protein